MSKNYCPYCMTPVPEGESCAVCKLTEGSYVASPHHLPPGTILMERYLVGRVLGEGGFGITYIGRDLRLELKVAIKEYYPVDRATRNASASLEVTNFIGPSAASFARGKQKFLDEAQAMARMDKQQVIVGVRDFFERNNTAYIVMEYIEGITFRELVGKKGGRISPDELFPMIEPLLHALGMMHANGLIHRDISPDNLMLEDGKVRLLDFGCAREASRGTETMTIALKHGYAPIEQYQQKGQGPWTDIYALCATIYYCLTGRVPPQALDRITEDELLLPGKLGVNITPEQEAALLKGMRLQPNRRFASAEELWGALYAKRPLPVTGQDGGRRESASVSYEAGKEAGGAPAAHGIEAETGAESAERASNVPPESTAPAECVGAAPTSAASAASGMSLLQRLAKNRKPLFVLAGAFVACIILAAAVWAGTDRIRQTAGDGQTAGTKKSKENGLAGPGEADTQRGAEPVDESLFDGAVVFSGGGGEEEFVRLMKDDSVAAVRVEGAYLDLPEVTLTKPVLVADDACMNTDRLTVTEDGYLQIEGELQMYGYNYMRLIGDGVRVSVKDGANVSVSEETVVWMDQGQAMEGFGNELPHRFVFSEDIFADAVSVTDEVSLVREANRGSVISIDADLALTDEVNFSAPVRISGGVTVRMPLRKKGTVYTEDNFSFNLGTGGVLLNDGVLQAALYMDQSAVAVNRGSILSEEADREASLWIQDRAIMINSGTVDAGDVSRFWDESFLMNLGTWNALDFYLTGGNMSNLGVITLPENQTRFEILNGSRLINGRGATITVAAGAQFVNDGWIQNQGEMLVEKDGGFDNAVLENYGRFQVESVAGIDAGRTGIYCGVGEYDFGRSETTVYRTDRGDLIDPKKLSQVSDEEELIRALNDADTEGIRIAGSVTVTRDLTVDKAVYVEAGGSLMLEEGARLTGCGAAIVLGNGATLQASDFLLYEGAQIYLYEGAHLTVNEGGNMNLDNALVWGEGGQIRMSDTALTLKNAAGFAFSWIDSLEMDGCEIALQKNGVFAVPHDKGMQMERSAITLDGEGASFYVAQDTAFTDCRLTIESGVLFNRAKTLDLKTCEVRIGENGALNSQCASLSLLAGASLENRGTVQIFGWDEYAFTVHGTIANYGLLELGLRQIDLSNAIENQGEVHYWSSNFHGEDFDWSAAVTGNAPIDLERE